MFDNRAYYNDWNHQLEMAKVRGTPVERTRVGIALDEPPTDFARLARSFGWHAEGPITDPSAAEAAVRRGRGPSSSSFSANYLGIPPLHVTLPLAAATTGLLVMIAVRFGLLAALACETCSVWLVSWVKTPDPSAWYFYVGAIAIGLVLALTLWGLHITTVSNGDPA